MEYYLRRRCGTDWARNGGVPPAPDAGKGTPCAAADGTKGLGAVLGALPEDERALAEETLASLPLMRFWYVYAASPVAKRFTKSQLASRYRGWRSFSEWMQKSHPEISRLESVTRRIGEGYLDSIKDDFSSATGNNYMYCVKEVFHYFLCELGIRYNPWDVVTRLPKDTMTRRDLTADEIGRLIAAAQRKGSEWALLFRLAAYTGMRLGECCRLEWKNIVMEKDIIQYIPSKTRGRRGDRPVTMPLHRELKRHLLRIPARLHWGPLMPDIAAQYAKSGKSVQRAVSKFFVEAGIETQKSVDGRKRKVSYASFHSIRHSFVSFTANAGVPLEVVRSMVGHDTANMTRHYYHADETLLRKAVSAVPTYDASGNCMSQAECVDARPAAVRLVELADALRTGLVTQAEYDAIRQEILASI